MSLIKRKWIEDQAINNQKIDPTDTYTITGLRVDGTNAVGRVSIGTNNPLDALHMRRTDTSVGMILDLDGYSGKSYQLYSDQCGNFHIRDMDNNFDRLTINSDPLLNRIGIDQSNPQDTLDIRSTLTAPAAVRLDTDDGFLGRAYRLVSDTDGAFKIIDVDGGDVNRFQIASTGTLTVSGDATFDSNFQINGTVTVINTEVVVADQLEINQTDNQAALIVSQDTPSATATVMRIENAGTGYALTVDYGNVGIGTLTPAAPLHVQGDIITADGANLGDTTHRIGTLYMASNINHLSNLQFNSNGAPQVTFDTTNGRVGIGSTAPTAPLDVVGNIIGSTNITAGTGVTATTGNITASTGDIIATLGDISALAGAVSADTSMSAGTTITAGTGITATTGNITATVGNVVAGATVQGADLNITTGPNTITGTTTNTGTFIIQDTTGGLCRLTRIGSGVELSLGVSNGSPSTWTTGVTLGDSYLKSSISQALHIGSASLTVPTMTLNAAGNVGIGEAVPAYPLHFGGEDAGTVTLVDKMSLGRGSSSTGVVGDGYGILFRHGTTSGKRPRSRVASVIGTGNNRSDLVLSPSIPSGTTPTETVRIYRGAIDSYMDFKASTGGNAYFTTYQGALADFRIKTTFSGVSNPDKKVEMGAINGGQTHITYGSGTYGISILSAGATPGYVGIGTQTPSAKLHVIGNAIVSGNANVGSLTTPTLSITGVGNVQLGLTRTGPGGGSTTYAITNGPGNYGWATPAAGSSLIQYASGTSLYVGVTGTANPHSVFTSTGSVGIGTLTPGAPEHVQGNIFTSNGANIGDNTHRIGTLYMSSDINHLSNLNFNSDSTTQITFDTYGRIGINSSTPAYHLDVAGSGNFINNGGSTLRVENTSSSWFSYGLNASLSNASAPANAAAIYADSKYNGRAIWAVAEAGSAIYATSDNAGSAVGYFRNFKGSYAGYFTAPNGQTLYSEVQGTDSTNMAINARCTSASSHADSRAINAVNFGAGYAGYFESASGETVHMESSSTTSGNFVLYSKVSSSSSHVSSRAVYAENVGAGFAIDATANTGYAGYFESGSGETVRMQSDSVAGGNYVLRCIVNNGSASSDSIAVMAQNYGNGRGIYASSDTGDTVYARSTGGKAIYGDAVGTIGYGVYGEASANSATAYAGYFTRSGTAVGEVTLYVESAGTGWYDRAIDVVSSGTLSQAVYASNSGASSIAVYAENTASTGTAVHAEQQHTSSTAYAGYFQAVGGGCLYARQTDNTIPGRVIEASLTSSTTTSASAYAIYATGGTQRSNPIFPGYAGYFRGDVEISGGTITQGAAKPFKIDHPLDPENKYLYHFSVESPDIRNAYFGQTVTENGFVLINLPDWWMALNGTDKSEYTYSLTPIGKWCQLYVSKEIENNQFGVSSLDGDCKFSWTVTAIRHDRKIEENRMKVEVVKTELDKKMEAELKEWEEERKKTVVNKI